jgi:hypothetical protein
MALSKRRNVVARMKAAAPTPRPKARTTPSARLSPTRPSPAGRVELCLNTRTWHLANPSVELALRWAYIVRNRRRWRGHSRMMADRCRTLLRDDLEGGDSLLNAIAAGGRVLVYLPPSKGQNPDERTFPWEYVISAASGQRENPIVVIRVVRREMLRNYGARGLLFVETSPPKLVDHYEYLIERDMVTRGFASVDVLKNPWERDLSKKVGRMRPEVVHLAGIDAHQGVQLLRARRDWRDQPAPNDGLWLNGDGCPTDAAEVARLLTSGKYPPRLVCCNFYNSAPRIASLSVVKGAGAAIGFQDAFDDAVAELFYANFFAEYQQDGNIAKAFTMALRELPLDQDPGTGLVLWIAQDLLDKGVHSAASPSPEPPTGQAEDQDQVGAEVRVRHKANYSLLHNSESIFQVFRAHRSDPSQPTTAQVRVELHVGRDRFTSRSDVKLRTRVTDLSRHVHLPLTSKLGRSLMEDVRSSLYVRIDIGKRVVYRKTHPITLAAIDEWRDSINANWLPSFVLPRDPAVAGVVNDAQQYLQALTDDHAAGFDGYQHCEAVRPALRVTGDPDWEAALRRVDLQVQALWWALVCETPLSYINPPPSFTEYTQRLRTPTDVVKGRRGTCIDLALLMTACMEYVGLKPAIFLLRGHALPGYWRWRGWQTEFHQMDRLFSGEPPLAPSEAALGDPGGEPDWFLPNTAWTELCREVVGERIAPFETVLLTGLESFGKARQEGTQRVVGPDVEDPSKPLDFESMIDLDRARESGVTPLPMQRSRER